MALLRYIQMVQGMPTKTETTTNFYISNHAITKRKMGRDICLICYYMAYY